MPIREYIVEDESNGCAYCQNGFERIEPLECPPFPFCPKCGAKITRCPGGAHVGRSKTTLDQRAKSAGFMKYEKLGAGEYEKKYGPGRS